MGSLVKTTFNVDAAKSFVDSVRMNTSYYVFASKPGPEMPELTKPLDSKAEDNLLYDQMLFGKRIKFDDIQLCAKRYDWTFGRVYDMYDDQVDLTDKQYYAVTQSGLDLKVYKCLFNNDGAPSLAEPFGTSPQPFETMEDGYIWKYMFTISSLDVERFANNERIPVVEDQDIIQSATPGSLDIIKVDSKGLRYNNYTLGVFGSVDNLRVGGNPLQYALGAAATNINGFYKNCLIRINSNTFTNGQFRLITDYQIINGRKIITIDEPFDFTPFATDSYEIYPNVFITDTGSTSTESCVARAIVNPDQANSISRVEILRVGRGYRSATAELRPDPSVSVTNPAILRPIIGPDGGHGSNACLELNSYFVGISSIFSGNSNPIIANNVMQAFGIIKEPLFADCTMELDPTQIQGVFLPNERLFRYRPIRLHGQVNVFSNGSVVGANSEFTAALRQNDKVLVVGSGNQLFANVTVISDVELKLNPIPTFDANNCDIYYTPCEYFAEVVGFDSPTLKLKNVMPVGFNISQYVHGELSQAYAKTANTANYLTIGSRPSEDFGAFNQIIRLQGLKLSSDNFVQNEIIQQTFPDGTSTAIGRVHSFEPGLDSQLDSLYITGEINKFANTGTISTIRNDSSQIVFEISNKYEGEIVKDSGDILYVENIFPVARKNDQVEIIKLFLEF